MMIDVRAESGVIEGGCPKCGQYVVLLSPRETAEGVAGSLRALIDHARYCGGGKAD